MYSHEEVLKKHGYKASSRKSDKGKFFDHPSGATVHVFEGKLATHYSKPLKTKANIINATPDEMDKHLTDYHRSSQHSEQPATQLPRQAGILGPAVQFREEDDQQFSEQSGEAAEHLKKYGYKLIDNGPDRAIYGHKDGHSVDLYKKHTSWSHYSNNKVHKNYTQSVTHTGKDHDGLKDFLGSFHAKGSSQH